MFRSFQCASYVLMQGRELKIGVGGAGSPSVDVRLLRCNVSSHAWVTLYAMNAKNFWCALIKNKQMSEETKKIVKWIYYHIKKKKSNASKFIRSVIFFFFS